MSNFFKLVGKAIRFTVHRPLQRFNISARSKKFLGPDAPKFAPAPRAIGIEAEYKKNPIQYPHLGGDSKRLPGFASVRQRRLESLQGQQGELAAPGQRAADEQLKLPARSFSETESDDQFVRELARRFEVTKKVTKSLPESVESRRLSAGQARPAGEASKEEGKLVEAPSARPLPKFTNLPLGEPELIWTVEKAPPGRLSLDRLQEMLINKLADDQHWTPAKLADQYKIKEEYADSLTKYLKQIRVIVSPRAFKAIDYTQRADPVYQATKHLVYIVDKSMRTKSDRMYDNTFLPHDQLDPEVRDLLDAPDLVKVEAKQEAVPTVEARRRPEPLRLQTLNRADASLAPPRPVKRLPAGQPSDRSKKSDTRGGGEDKG